MHSGINTGLVVTAEVDPERVPGDGPPRGPGATGTGKGEPIAILTASVFSAKKGTGEFEEFSGYVRNLTINQKCSTN
jgi:hypothetical protein